MHDMWDPWGDDYLYYSKHYFPIKIFIASTWIPNVISRALFRYFIETPPIMAIRMLYHEAYPPVQTTSNSFQKLPDDVMRLIFLEVIAPKDEKKLRRSIYHNPDAWENPNDEARYRRLTPEPVYHELLLLASVCQDWREVALDILWENIEVRAWQEMKSLIRVVGRTGRVRRATTMKLWMDMTGTSFKRQLAHDDDEGKKEAKLGWWDWVFDPETEIPEEATWLDLTLARWGGVPLSFLCQFNSLLTLDLNFVQLWRDPRFRHNQACRAQRQKRHLADPTISPGGQHLVPFIPSMYPHLDPFDPSVLFPEVVDLSMQLGIALPMPPHQDYEAIAILLRGCPALECLKLRTDILTPNLPNIGHFRQVLAPALEEVAPRLRKFELKLQTTSTPCWGFSSMLARLDNVEELKIDTYALQGDVLSDLSPHARLTELEISQSTRHIFPVTILQAAIEGTPHLRPSLSNLTRLTVVRCAVNPTPAHAALVEEERDWDNFLKACRVRELELITKWALETPLDEILNYQY